MRTVAHSGFHGSDLLGLAVVLVPLGIYALFVAIRGARRRARAGGGEGRDAHGGE